MSTTSRRRMALSAVALLASATLVVLLSERPARQHDRAPVALSTQHDATAEPIAPVAAPSTPGSTQRAQPTPLATDVGVPPAGTPTSARSTSLRGRLRRLADGSPLAGWVVTLRSRHGGGTEPEELHELDADGRFELHDLPVDQRELFASPATHSHDEDWEQHIEWSGTITELDRVLDTGWILAGRAFSTSGAPLREGWVLKRHPASDSTARESQDWWLTYAGARLVDGELKLPEGMDVARLDARGNFRMHDVKPGSRGSHAWRAPAPPPTILLEARAAEHAVASLAVELGLDTRVVEGLELVLQPGGAFDLRVLDGRELGCAVESAKLLAEWTPEGPRLLASALPLPAPFGRSLYRPVVHEPTCTADMKARTAFAEEPRHFHMQHLAAGRHLLRLKLADPPTLPEDRWPGYATLNTNSFTSATAEEVPLLDGPSHAPPRSWLQAVDVRTDVAAQVTLRVPWGGVLTGQVLDLAAVPQVGAAVKAYQVFEWPAPAPESGAQFGRFDSIAWTHTPAAGGGGTLRLEVWAGTSRTDERGRYTLERLPPGRALLRVTPASEGPAPLETWIDVTPGGTTQRDLLLEHAR